VGKSREVTHAPAWSDWQPLAGVPPLTSDVLAEILDGGQAFRWHRAPDGTWLGVWSDCVARLRLASDERLEWSAPAPIAPRAAAALPEYFATTGDFGALADLLPWRSDTHLACCLAEFRGLRILRQPFGETLLGFLCSATKQIVQIKQMLALLASRHGDEITPGFHALPTWPQLAAIPEATLRTCLRSFSPHILAGSRKRKDCLMPTRRRVSARCRVSAKKSPTACCSSAWASSRRFRSTCGF